ncbi:MAG TPA: hypothetical protein PLS55_12155, partial [Thermogutta sp.]|nr:hypothetical protein [Thermogutta sp.]
VTHTLRVQSAGGRIAAAQAVQVAADRLMARNTLDNPSLIRPQTLQTQLTSEGATVVVPRYGCVIVEMELK